MKTANEMGIDEVFDEIAGLLGWERYLPAGWVDTSDIGREAWRRVGQSHGDNYFHPVPRSLDTLAGIWPEGWLFNIDNLDNAPSPWRAHGWKHDDDLGPHDQHFIGDCDTELLARARLTLSVLRVSKSERK